MREIKLMIMNKLIDWLAEARNNILEEKEREEFVRTHCHEIQNAEEFWDKYH